MSNPTKMGDDWFDQVWFTVVSDGQNLTDRRIDIAYTHFLKNELIKLRNILRETAAELEQLRQVRLDLEQNKALVVPAFSHLRDVMTLNRWRQSAFIKYQHYDKPTDIFEATISSLYQLFPYQPTDSVGVFVFAGEYICKEHRFVSGERGAGGIQTEVPDLWPAKKWASSHLIGFRYGLSVVKVSPAEPVYKLDASDLAQLSKDAEFHLKQRQIAPFSWDYEPELENFYDIRLREMIKQKFDIEPGQKPNTTIKGKRNRRV